MDSVRRADILGAVAEMRKMAELADVMEETGDPEGALAIRVAIHDRLRDTARDVDAATGGDVMTRVALWNPLKGLGTKLKLVAPKYGEELLPEIEEQMVRGPGRRAGEALNSSQRQMKLQALERELGKGGVYQQTGTQLTPRGYVAGGLAGGALGTALLQGGRGPEQMPTGADGIPSPGGGSVSPSDLPPTSDQLPTGPADIPYPGAPPSGVMPGSSGMMPAPVGGPDPQAAMQMQQVIGAMQQMMGKVQELDMRLRNVGA